MDSLLREQFILVMMRFKRIDFCPSSVTGLQQSELVVMGRASDGCVCDGRGIGTSDIQKDLHISKPSVSQTLNNLERKGYVVRMIDPADRRKITVTLTPEGKKVLADAQQYYAETLDRTLEQFGIENTRIVLELINRLMDIMQKDKQ